MTPRPSSNGLNGCGRDKAGRFSPGWKGGPGNPHAKKTAALRRALYGAVSAKDLRAVVKRLLDEAQAGDTAAAKLLLAYTLGEPQPFDLIERLGRLEEYLVEASDE
jgi:hypothetical protein